MRITQQTKTFYIFIVLALGLATSWLFPITRSWWDTADYATFAFLNGTLRNRETWQLILTLASLNTAKIVIGFFMSIFYLHYLFYGKNNSTLQRFVELCTLTIIAAVGIILIKIFIHTGIDYHRRSPSLTINEAFRLSHVFPGYHIRDASANSFPGDNAIVLFSWTGILWFLGKKAYGIPATMFALIFTLPRLISGAHWLSDVIIGGGAISLITLAFTLHTSYLKSILNLTFKRYYEYKKI